MRAASLILLAVLCPVLLEAQEAYYDGLRPADGYSETAGGAGALDAQQLKGPPGWVPGVWSMPKTGRSSAFLFRESAALAYPAIAYPGGGGVEIKLADEKAQTIGRRMAPGIAFRGHTAVYASFLMKVSTVPAQGTAYVRIEGIGGMGAGVLDGSLMVFNRGPGGVWTPNPLGPACEPDTTYYFVMKVADDNDEWAQNDTMEMWINPQDVSSESAASSNALVYHVSEPGNFGAISGGIFQALLHVENFAGVTVNFDEFRLGLTWESVTGPVEGPKPPPQAAPSPEANASPEAEASPSPAAEDAKAPEEAK